MLQRFFRQWFVLALVLVCVTSCELEQYGTYTETHRTDGAEKLDCEPGEYEYKGQCVPAGLPPDMPCPPGETLLDDGRCQPAGLPLDMQCPPGELALENGKCQPAGVPPEMCGEGFEPDGKMGCNAILPKDPCPFGLMAVPGETECHEVAPCGKLPYPAVVYDALEPPTTPTQFVNAAYGANDSDGSMLKPWRTVQEGIDAAIPGAIVAIAEGTYEENLVIEKQVKLWGVCPKKVAINGTELQPSITITGNKADGAQIYNLAITGVLGGIDVSDAEDVVLESVWIHDTGERGLDIEYLARSPSVALRRSLIERAHSVAAFVSGGDLGIEETTIRDTLDLNGFAYGVNAEDEAYAPTRTHLSIHDSLIEKFQQVAVLVRRADTEITTSVIRDSAWRGVEIFGDAQTSARATISRAVIESTNMVGLRLEDSVASIEYTSIKHTKNLSSDYVASGILVIGDKGSATATIDASIIDDVDGTGIKISCRDQSIGENRPETCTNVAITSTIARRSHYDANVYVANGLQVANFATDPERVQVTKVRGSVFEDNNWNGIRVQSSNVTVENTLVRNQGVHGIYVDDSFRGDFVAPANIDIRASAIERNRSAGIIVWGSHLKIESSVVANNLYYPETHEGSGLWLTSSITTKTPASAEIRSVRFDRNDFVGINTDTKSRAQIDTSMILATQFVDHHGGYGYYSHNGSMRMTNSLLDGNKNTGITIEGGEADIEATLVRHTNPNGDANNGVGIGAVLNDKLSRPRLTISHSSLMENTGVALLADCADITIEASFVQNTHVDNSANWGRGINIQCTTKTSPSVAAIFDSRIEDCHQIGVYASNSELTMQRSTVRRTKSDTSGHFGDGIALVRGWSPTTASISNVLVERSDRADVSTFGAHIALEASALQCGTYNLSMQPFGEFAPSLPTGEHNHCGCPDATDECKITDVVLEVPQEIPLNMAMLP